MKKSIIHVAVSGGVDSMALFDLTSRKKNFEVRILHFDHKTPYAKRARKLVENLAQTTNTQIEIFEYEGSEQTEFAWSNWRNKIMLSFKTEVQTAHHIDDSTESYLMRHRLIAEQKQNIKRPFIAQKWSKKKILEYANRKKLYWLDDPTNDSSSLRRNKIRNELIPLLRECGINPHRIVLI